MLFLFYRYIYVDAAKSETKRLKEDTDLMVKEKGEICSQILLKQRKSKELESDSKSICQVTLNCCFLSTIRGHILVANSRKFFKSFSFTSVYIIYIWYFIKIPNLDFRHVLYTQLLYKEVI